MSTSVYCVTNNINGKVYFGKAVSVPGRWASHLWEARHGSQTHFHRAIRKYGASVFHLETLVTFETNEEASAHEIRLIANAAPGSCYNIARGGDGGPTMTPTQLDSQFGIPAAAYDKFRRAFQQGLTVRECMAEFGVSENAVVGCARRLGLSFAERRRAKRLVTQKSRARFTPEERSLRQSLRVGQMNKARGASLEQQQEIVRLYSEQHLTALEVAVRLGISKGSVRGAINRAYRTLSPEARADLKRKHGSAVRTGPRNPNFRAKS